jgi:RHS repeat-associated protein
VEDLTKSENFTYDSLGRLSAAQTGVVNNTAGAKTWSLTWTYDRLGNRLSQAMVGGDPTLPVNQPNFTIDPATNRIVGYCYDQAGNLLDDASCPAGSHKYFYDAANRLTKINTTAAVYTYFGASRIKKVVGSTTTRYIYAGGKPIAEYTGATPTLSTEYVYAGSQLLVTFAGTNTTYHHPDRLSNRAETNSSGTRGRTFGHLPYGEVWYETGTADKWKFTTYERDSATGETGLDYAQFRYYASPQGRFMGPDPLAGNRGAPQSLNGFAYAANDPVNAMDPKGLWCDGDGHGVCDPWGGHGGDMGFWDGIWLRDTVSLGEGYASTTWIFFPGVGNYDPRADFRDTAVKLSNDKTKTDCEKLARLIFKIGQILPDVGGGRANSGVGTLLGGLTEQNPYGGRNDSNYRVGVFRHDPYYASGFQDSGFLPQFQDQSNQVRHFVGWFGAGFYSPLGAGYARSRLYESEGTQDPSNPDVALGLAAIDMGSNFKGDYAKLAQDFWHKICGGNTDLKF